MSGIDVGTQRLNQQFQDPWLAIVIDPNATISNHKVDIGAFRTYAEGTTSTATKQQPSSTHNRLPLSKIEDFGVHADAYYRLSTSTFQSSVDSRIIDYLWSKEWVSTLSQSTAAINQQYTTDQIEDIAAKLNKSFPRKPITGFVQDEIAGLSVTHPTTSSSSKVTPNNGPVSSSRAADLHSIALDTASLTSEQHNAWISQLIKAQLF